MVRVVDAAAVGAAVTLGREHRQLPPFEAAAVAFVGDSQESSQGVRDGPHRDAAHGSDGDRVPEAADEPLAGLVGFVLGGVAVGSAASDDEAVGVEGDEPPAAVLVGLLRLDERVSAVALVPYVGVDHAPTVAGLNAVSGDAGLASM